MASRGQRVQAIIAAEAVRDGLTQEEAVEQRGVAPSSYRKMQRIRDVDRSGEIFAKVLTGEIGMVPAATLLGIHKSEKLRQRIANDGQKRFYTQDLFDEAVAPLRAQADFYEKLSFDFPHVSPIEARRRLEVIEELCLVLAKTRTGLSERSHTYTTRAPTERKCA